MTKKGNQFFGAAGRIGAHVGPPAMGPRIASYATDKKQNMEKLDGFQFVFFLPCCSDIYFICLSLTTSLYL
jgi:hypothetical protein